MGLLLHLLGHHTMGLLLHLLARGHRQHVGALLWFWRLFCVAAPTENYDSKEEEEEHYATDDTQNNIERRVVILLLHALLADLGETKIQAYDSKEEEEEH